MGLLTDVKIDGSLIKDTLSGVGGLMQDIKTLFTGQLSPEKEAEILQKLADSEQELMIAQVEVNKIEAASSSVFVAGWRPAIGWICAISIGSYFVPQAVMAVLLWTMQCTMVMWATDNVAILILPAFPQIFGWEQLFGLVFAMLGIGTLRTAEKWKGVAR